MTQQGAFDPKNILQSTVEKRGLLEELNIPPKAITFIRANQRTIQIAAAATVAIILAWNGYTYYIQKREDSSAAQFAAAIQLVDSESKTGSLNAIIDDYSGTGAAVWATIELAHEALAGQRYGEAASMYKKALDALGSGNIGAPLVQLNLAQAYEGNNDLDKALAIYSKLSGVSGFVTEGLIGTARVSEKLGRKDEAVAAYKKIKADENNSPATTEWVDYKLSVLE